MGPTVAILDYAAGNLTSVACAMRHLGQEPVVTSDPAEIGRAERVIFPGVGAAGATMASLRKLGLHSAVREVYASGRPLLGICIGCQVVLERSEEDGDTTCLGLLPGRVRRFQFASGVARKIPHMGWNEVTFRGDHAVFADIPAASQFYFVHSYYPEPVEKASIMGTCVYGGIEFVAAMAHKNLVTVQFHAEKSGPPGLQLLKNFLSWQPTAETEP